MPHPVAPPEPPPIPGVRRSFVTARGVRFHVTEAGPEDGLPVLALHGWPEHHYLWRDLLADPPPGLRIIAPDLPGYGWSGPPPHRWAKQDVADDLLALMDAMGLERVVLTGHDWGGWIGHLLVLGHEERFSAYLALNIPHQWNGPRQALPTAWRIAMYQPWVAMFGVPLHRHAIVTRLVFGLGTTKGSFSAEDARWFIDRFRDPVCARTATLTYRTFLTRELPRSARNPERRRATIPIRTLFGVDDKAISRTLVAAEHALADDYAVEYVEDCSHFIVDERPALVRDRLVALAAQHPPR